MSDNLYQTPESELRSEMKPETAFYVVSPGKFLILFFSTMGLYQLYWFYQNWKCYSQVNQEEMMPFWRTVFMVFYTHALFDLMSSKAKEVDETYNWNAGISATICVVALLVSGISNQLSLREIGSPFTDFLGLTLFPIIGWTMYQAQKCVNFLSADSAGNKNSQLTALNYLWIVIGILYWLLVSVGQFELMNATVF